MRVGVRETTANIVVHSNICFLHNFAPLLGPDDILGPPLHEYTIVKTDWVDCPELSTPGYNYEMLVVAERSLHRQPGI